MPSRTTVKTSKKDLKEGKSPSTAAGEFVHEEIEHVRKGKHGASSAKQAIAIGLSKARRAGVPLRAPSKGKASAGTRKKAKQDSARGKSGAGKTKSARRSQATTKALKKEPRSSASRESLSAQTRQSSRKRSATSRSKAAQQAATTKGASGRKAAAKKGAKTRARHAR